MHAKSPAPNYPDALPVVASRREIVAAIREHRVVVVVSETGSGKTTQLPKMVAEALDRGAEPDGARRGGRRRRRPLIGCTQPRRIAASSVAERVAEELKVPLGDWVGYQVRFEDRTGPETRIKFMTDGILLAETQGDPDLRRYDALILDEAHERSLNIDFLLGYLKNLLDRRPDLRLVISSATLDAGSFAEFFRAAPGPRGEAPEVPVIEAEGRTYPVDEQFLPPDEEEELADHVVRACDWLAATEDGDVLVFLPGEREIRECADKLDARGYPRTEVLPLFARLGLGDQQRVFHPGPKRRIVLATNVAETSLTIPRIVCVVDSGLARVSRWSPGRGVQRLQIEEVSQASARQRKGRCGRVRAGVCVRLYDEENLAARAEFTDPEIRRSSLAGVILRMKSLGLPDIEAFPFIDPPAPKAVAEGYRTLREVGALDKARTLTESGVKMARMPVDPRLARMLLEAEKEGCVARVLPVVAGLETQDVRERPAEKAREADAAHQRWKHEESDFLAMLKLWDELQAMRKGRGWQRNRLRKFCREYFVNFRRVTEWANVHDELRTVVRKLVEMGPDTPRPSGGGKAGREAAEADYGALHRALLAGVPKQFGLWDREEKVYRSASGGHFAVFPGSGLFGGKRWDWVMGMELVETTRLWARRVARIDPEWVERVAPHLCRSRYGDGHWDAGQGAVYAKETVICGGLPVVQERPVHFGRIDPAAARQIFVREGLLQGGIKGRSKAVERLRELEAEVALIEHKLRRRGGLWSEEAVVEYFEARLPDGLCTAKAYHRWRKEHEDAHLPDLADVVWEDPESLDVEGFPDWIAHDDQEYAVYYHCEPGARDDGVTLGVHIDQLPHLPPWLPGWGVPGDLETRAEWMIRSLPKDLRRACQPIGERAADFADSWREREKREPVEVALARELTAATGFRVEPGDFDTAKWPEELVTKVWIGNDDGEELGFGDSVEELAARLGATVKARFEAAANEAWEVHGLTAWPDFEIPEVVETDSGPAYPALVDEGDAVGCRAFSSAVAARESHRAGVARLLCLGQPDQVGYLKKKFPLDLTAKVELPKLAGGVGELVFGAAEGVMAGGRIAGAAEFDARRARARGDWWPAAQAIGAAVDEALATRLSLVDWIHRHRDHRHLGVVAEDLDEQLAWLFRTHFAWRAGYDRLIDYARPLRAMRSRIDRLESLPLAKDLEKMERVRAYWEPWFAAWIADPDDAGLWDYGWLLTEFRISLFAPDLPVLGKVSEKRLKAGWTE
jgi:ATP-dependent helicase HrpA